MSKKIDFDKLKIFGYNRFLLKYNVYDPTRLFYAHSIRYGTFVFPRNCKNRNIGYLVRNFQQAKIYEKLFNPNGFKAKITSNFPKPPDTEKLPKFNLIMLVSDKKLKPNQMKFIVDINMDKYQIHQIFTKLYNMKVTNITTAIQPGKVMRDTKSDKRKYIRRPERKVAVIDFDFPIQKKLKEERLNNEPKNKYKKYDKEEKETKKLIPKLKAIIPQERHHLLELRTINTLDGVRNFIREKQLLFEGV
jgi:ribosomal protein L23